MGDTLRKAMYRGLWVSLANVAHTISMGVVAKASPYFCSHPGTSYKESKVCERSLDK